MWKLYDDLIDNIEEGIKITDYYVGSSWTMVRTEDNIGIALTVRSSTRPRINQKSLIGMDLKDAAELVKSWNFKEASIGNAAINAYYNTYEKIDALQGFADIDFSKKDLESRKKKDVFIEYREQIKGKKVTIIGRFPKMEKQFASVCDMSVLERNPSKGDYPDSACEFILPEQDYVFITGMTIINKTLPRLLQIIRKDTKAVLIGPSVPMTDILFRHNIDGLSGFCVTDQEKSLEILKTGEDIMIFKGGRMLSIKKEDYKRKF